MTTTEKIESVIGVILRLLSMPLIREKLAPREVMKMRETLAKAVQ